MERINLQSATNLMLNLTKEHQQMRTSIGLMVMLVAMAIVSMLWERTETPELIDNSLNTSDEHENGTKTVNAHDSIDSALSPSDSENENGPNIASYSLSTSHNTLPPINSPLKDIFEDLDKRARSGDGTAACRLSADVFRCLRLPKERQFQTNAIQSAARTEPGSLAEERAIKLAKAQAASLAQDEKLCEGFHPSGPNAAWEYVKIAAANGNTHAMVQLASSPPLDYENFARDLDGWAEYRQIAGPYLRQAAAAGEPFALYYLWWVYAGYPTPGGVEILPPDPYQARVFGYALIEIGDARIKEMVNRYFAKKPDAVSIQQNAAAIAEGVELAKQRFSNVSNKRLNNFPQRDTHCTGVGINQPGGSRK